jgi:putative ABC transport system permease protein
MIRNYFIIALRSLWKNRLYSLINIVGLTVGLTAGVMMLLWVQDELSFDRFHKNAQALYRININIGDNNQIWASSPAPLAPFAVKDLPEVKQAVRVNEDFRDRLFQVGDKKVTETEGGYADANLFSVFDFPLVLGDQNKPFADIHSIAISEKTAEKYFGKENPILRTIRIDDAKDFTVTAVYKNMPTNSSIKFEWVRPFMLMDEGYDRNYYPNGINGDWGNFNYQTYFLLTLTANPNNIAQKITAIHKKNQPGFDRAFYKLQKFTETHLIAADGKEYGKQTVNIFLIVALITLLIASINYINLTTARASKRAKEVGVRKVIGADQAQLFGQFFVESLVVFGIALVLAIGCIYVLMPTYNQLSGKELVFNITNPSILMVLGSTALVTIVFSGVYPALVLSSFNPLKSLKGTALLGGSNAVFRQILVVVQFSLSIILIIGSLVIGQQLKFIREKALGYEKENVFGFDFNDKMGEHLETIKAELARQTGITGVTISSQNLVQLGSSSGDTDWEGKDPNRSFIINQLSVDKDFIDVFKLKILEGQGFLGTKADSGRYILNETAVQQIGLKNPIGKRFSFHSIKGTVVGIVKDFHFASLHQSIEPIILFHQPGWYSRINIKTDGKNAKSAIAAAEKIWKKYNPSLAFNYEFLDDTYTKMYKSDQRTGSLFNIFAAIAIFISCLGLFGLATFTAERRFKEIGIRKVLGASVGQIIGLLSKDFLLLVLLSFLIAAPVAWFFMSRWLQDFVYRIDLSWWIFALAGVLALVIAFATVSMQSIRAAVANPVKSLRTE